MNGCFGSNSCPERLNFPRILPVEVDPARPRSVFTSKGLDLKIYSNGNRNVRHYGSRQRASPKLALSTMKLLTRVLIVVLLIGFAGAITVHNAASATMVVAMALGDNGGMAGCDGCGTDGDDDAARCDIVCITSLSVMVGADDANTVISGGSFTDGAAIGFIGRAGPPDPYPPRSFIRI